MTLILLAGGLALGLALISNQAQRENFETEFEDLSKHVATSLAEQLGQTIAAMDTLSVQITSATHSMAELVPFDQLNWPNITIPGELRLN